MNELEEITCVIKEKIELNLAYMPFIQNGGFFWPTNDFFSLGEKVMLSLLLPEKKEPLSIMGKVVWITTKNTLHHTLPGIGIQFIDPNANAARIQIEDNLDKTMDVGGYSYGFMEEINKS